MKGVAARGVSVWGGRRAPLRRVILYCFVTLVFGFLVLPNFIVVPLSVTDSIYLQFPPRGFTWRWYQDYFGVEGASHFGTAGRWIPATLISFQLAMIVMMVAVPLGTLAAYGLTRGRFRGKSVLNAILISPLIVPILVTAIALFFFLSDKLTSFFSPLPAPDLPNGPALPSGGWLAFLVVMLILVVGTLAVMWLPNLMRKPLEGELLEFSERFSPWLRFALPVEIPLFLLALFVLLGEWALMISMLMVGSAALAGILVPRLLRRPLEGRWLDIQDTVGPWLPLILVLTLAFFLFPMFNGWTDKIEGSTFSPDNPIPPVPGVSPGLILAHIMLAVPFVVIILSATLRGVDSTLDQASATLGAGPFTTLRKIVLPVMIPGLAAAAFFAFLTSFDELLIALFLSTTEISTLPREIFDGIRTEISPTIAAISTMLIFLTVIILSGVVLLQLHLKKKSGITE
ncbi:MAG: ABC transporter permease [Dehalococcoidia bacterium]